MADQIKKLSAGHSIEVLDAIMTEVEEARGEYDNLGERLDEMSSDTPPPSTAAPAMDGTAAAGTSTDYARADHVHPSDTSKQDTLNAAQLAAVNSGIDSAKVEQIETNKNNILSLTPTTTTTEYTAKATETWEKTSLSIPVAGKKAVYFAGNIMYNNAEPLGVGIGTGNTFALTSIIAVEESNTGTLRGALSCTGIYYNNSPSPQTLYLWVKYKTTQKNMITLMYRQL